MRYVHLDSGVLHRGELILVNRDHPLKQEPGPSQRAELAPGCELTRQAASMLKPLLAETGPGIALVSGWRSFDEQQQIFRDSLRAHGEKFTRQYVAVPGCSEHQTGLAIDLGEDRPGLDFLRPDFPDRGPCAAFLRRKAEFGFILRYPAGKESVTGIASEPWHFRYVGRPHAWEMERLGLTLEEYVDYLRGFSQTAPLHVTLPALEHQVEVPFGALPRKETCEIWFVPAKRGEPLTITLPDGRGAVLSGNNVDGVIVTCPEVTA